MAVVGSFATRAEAEVAASMLRARNIDVRVVADDADGTIGVNLAAAGCRLEVPDGQRREALDLLEAPIRSEAAVPGLVILDVNGTLFPLDPVAEQFAAVGLPGRLDVWFARILRDGFAAAAAGTFVAFPDLARHHLAVLLEAHGIEVTEDRSTQVLGAFEQVTAHPDVAPALQRLRDHGVTVTTMTNGTVAITRDFLAREGLAEHVDATYDAAMAGRWKPAPDAYQHVLEQHDQQARDAALVAVHPWDVHGAATAGLRTGWVNRTGARYPEGFAAPDVTAGSMESVVDGLLAR